MTYHKIHIVPNAHLDAVWFWRWLEGAHEAIATARTAVELMNRYPQLTFTRGEVNFYEPIFAYAPELVEPIRQLIQEGRWDVVGGNYVQTDTNTPSTFTFLRQFRMGRQWFQEHFGLDVRVGWAADSAGHAAGLPDIFAASGIEAYAFGRPTLEELELPNQSFIWKGASGASILSTRLHGCYVCERYDACEALEAMWKAQENFPQRNLLFCMGLGDHGGGPTARHVEELLAYADAHRSECDIQFSTLTRFFTELATEKEVLPEFSGELNYKFRGVYLTNIGVKHRFFDLEQKLQKAVRVNAAVNRALALPPTNLDDLEKTLLFNTFHDILPGDSTETVDIDQRAQMDGARNAAELKTGQAMSRLAAALKTTVPPPMAPDQPGYVPYLLFNPRPVPFDGYVRMEHMLDYRPLPVPEGADDSFPGFSIVDEEGRRLAAQATEPEYQCFRFAPWRMGVLFPLHIPPMGYRQLAIGVAKDRLPCPPSPVHGDTNGLTNGIMSVRLDGDRLQVTCRGVPVAARDGLHFASYQDRYGCWGGMTECHEAIFCPICQGIWQAGTPKLLEDGPESARLYVPFCHEKSHLDLFITLLRGEEKVHFEATLLWQERDSRLRLCMDAVPSATFAVPGGIQTRGQEGDMPGGRWFRTDGFGLASDHFSSYTLSPDFCAVNLVRGTPYCTDVVDAGLSHPEWPLVDMGRHRFVFTLTTRPEEAADEAEAIANPPEVVRNWPHEGHAVVPTEFRLEPACLQMVDLEQNERGQLVATLQNASAEAVEARVNGRSLGLIPPWTIQRLPCEG